jgi:hypothetical protein
MSKPVSVVYGRLWGPIGGHHSDLGENSFSQSKELESSAIEGDRPVDEMELESLGRIPKYHGTREILWEFGRTIFQG